MRKENIAKILDEISKLTLEEQRILQSDLRFKQLVMDTTLGIYSTDRMSTKHLTQSIPPVDLGCRGGGYRIKPIDMMFDEIGYIDKINQIYMEDVEFKKKMDELNVSPYDSFNIRPEVARRYSIAAIKEIERKNDR